MDEELKSIWKKPWQGLRGALLWFALLAVAAFVVIFCIGLIAGGDRGLLIAALVSSFCIALLFVLAILFFRWVCCWRNFRRFLFGFACFLTLIALFYAEENWRGKHAWKKFKAAWEAKGERFDIATFVPPPVPDDQNFAMTPIWVEEISASMGVENAKKWYADKVAALGHTNFVRRLEMPVEFWSSGLEFTNRIGNWRTAEKTDLKRRQEYYRKLAAVTNLFPVPPQPRTPAADVLLALSKYDSTLEELRTASKLPRARFPLGYNDDNPAGILLPHLAPLNGCTVPLQLRAVAELQSGQTEKALDDIKLMLRLADTIRTEPTLISHLVRIAMLQVTLLPVWEGLADHKWNDAQLAALDAELAKLDSLADYHFTMRGERAFGFGIVDYVRGNRREFLSMVNLSFDKASNYEFQALFIRFIPRGWFEQNKVAIARMHSEYFLPPVNLKTRIVSPAAVRRADAASKHIRLTPYNWLSRLLLSALSNISPKSARAQSCTDMARIACALERYRLAQGSFPEKLDVLAPQFMENIPHDIIGGQPLKYRRTDDGQFILYSVGWNETDDGGKVVLTKDGKGVNPKEEGDWVWRYPAN